MNIQDFENLIKQQIDEVIESIIQENQVLNISTKSRSGAEISNWLEDKFVEMTKNHPYLKNISPTFRRTPTNQLQVNMAAEPIYRTREEFIELLIQKIQEGLERQIEKAQKTLENTQNEEPLLKQQNKQSENAIKSIQGKI